MRTTDERAFPGEGGVEPEQDANERRFRRLVAFSVLRVYGSTWTTPEMREQAADAAYSVVRAFNVGIAASVRAYFAENNEDDDATG